MNVKKILILFILATVIAGILILIAYSRVWGKTEIECKIHINEQLVMESVYGESPTFAIWLENPASGEVKTIFVTNRAGNNDWEGKAEVPALPLWTKISESERQFRKESPEEEIDAASGATPTPGYFTARAKVKPDSEWLCWIEMNLAGDYNDAYKEFDEETKITDEFAIGQPALVYRAAIQAKIDNIVVPEIVGMAVTNADEIIQPLSGITTAINVFDEITISIVKPKPKIINK